VANAKDYKHIRCWGKMLGSFEPYIERQQIEAAIANAPLDAIYEIYDANGPSGVWATADKIEREDTKVRLAGYMKELYGEQHSA
jgi:hypothetical protein